jgi:hypothetical protein
MFARHTPHAHFISLFDYFCDTPLPTLNYTSGEDGVAGSNLTCTGSVPGTDIHAYPEDDPHLNTAGSIYLWPHLCDAMEAAGLF